MVERYSYLDLLEGFPYLHVLEDIPYFDLSEGFPYLDLLEGIPYLVGRSFPVLLNVFHLVRRLQTSRNMLEIEFESRYL